MPFIRWTGDDNDEGSSLMDLMYSNEEERNLSGAQWVSSTLSELKTENRPKWLKEVKYVYCVLAYLYVHHKGEVENKLTEIFNTYKLMVGCNCLDDLTESEKEEMKVVGKARKDATTTQEDFLDRRVAATLCVVKKMIAKWTDEGTGQNFDQCVLKLKKGWFNVEEDERIKKEEKANTKNNKQKVVTPARDQPDEGFASYLPKDFLNCLFLRDLEPDMISTKDVTTVTTADERAAQSRSEMRARDTGAKNALKGQSVLRSAAFHNSTQSSLLAARLRESTDATTINRRYKEDCKNKVRIICACYNIAPSNFFLVILLHISALQRFLISMTDGEERKELIAQFVTYLETGRAQITEDVRKENEIRDANEAAHNLDVITRTSRVSQVTPQSLVLTTPTTTTTTTTDASVTQVLDCAPLPGFNGGMTQTQIVNNLRDEAASSDEDDENVLSLGGGETFEEYKRKSEAHNLASDEKRRKSEEAGVMAPVPTAILIKQMTANNVVQKEHESGCDETCTNKKYACWMQRGFIGTCDNEICHLHGALFATQKGLANFVHEEKQDFFCEVCLDEIKSTPVLQEELKSR